MGTRSISAFRSAIRRLKADSPEKVPGIWYLTQKEHWLGWLSEYSGAGAYGRTGRGYDARYSYNHIVNCEMLEWLARAAGVPVAKFRAAQSASRKFRNEALSRQSAAFRKHVT